MSTLTFYKSIREMCDIIMIIYGDYLFLNISRVHEHFKKSIKRCYAMYSTGVEDKAPFGLKNGTA